MQFNADDLAKANDKLKTIPFYPPDPGAQAAVTEFLAKICPHREALLWLTDQLAEHCARWMGLSDVRAILSMKFKPADGIEGYFVDRGFDQGAVKLLGDWPELKRLQ